MRDNNTCEWTKWEANLCLRMARDDPTGLDFSGASQYYRIDITRIVLGKDKTLCLNRRRDQR
jgi:hypothetical protein